MKVKDIGEFGLIDRISKEAIDKNISVGIGDDAAVYKTDKGLQVVTTDTLIEGDHFRKEWFTPKQFEFTTFDAESKDLVTVLEIPFFTFCEHHIAPFFGVAHVGYIPNKKIVGPSKIPRLVEQLSKRLNIQENFTNDIVNVMQEKLDPLGVIVMTKATHTCMTSRGIKSINSYTSMVKLSGVFETNAAAKSEFIQMLPK